MGAIDALSAPPELHRGHAVFSDFDGTLVEIVAKPDLVRVTPDLQALLQAVASLLDGALAIVSGRPIDELSRLLAPFSGPLMGLYGLECRRTNGTVVRWLEAPEFAGIRAAFAAFTMNHEGVALEDKGATLALHYRQAPQFAAQCHALVQRAAEASRGAFKAIAGKKVAELVPQRGSKGYAITTLLSEPPFSHRVPVFLGDDAADEEGFAVVNRLGGVSIRIGKGVTSARFRFATIGEVRAWLARSVAA